jgi:catechol 2,3-dioxygenase-like lactoylglutathione lyase family enzyme
VSDTYQQMAKQMAKRLREDLATRDFSITHSEALELVAHQHGVRDWNTLVARPTADSSSTSTSGSAAGSAVPILRIFDRDKAVEFYVDYLGFAIDWEHGHADHSPLYAQVHRGPAVLHLSEHHGDASPGGAALIPVADVSALHDELHARPHDYAHPGIRDEDWGRVMVVVDPFHNRLVFHQPVGGVPEGIDPRPTEAAGPIELSYDLACSPELAWDAFVRRIDRWWHRAYAPPGLREIRIDPMVGEAATMSLDDGTTYPWGTVIECEQPRHYAQTFTLAQDPEHPSRLDVWFEPRGRGCRMRFEHGGWTAGNVGGRAKFNEWHILLDRFAAVAEGRPVPEVPASVTGEATSG